MVKNALDKEKHMKLTCLLAVTTIHIGPSALFAHEVHREVAYGNGERNVMDIFLPQGVVNPPIVMYIHGGGWTHGDKSTVDEGDRLKRMNEAGFAVAAINYTFSSQAVWPAQKNDVEAAIRFLQNHDKTYGYDKTRFAVWGQSAGAHLALWSGLMSAEDESLDVDAVVSWYSPSNLFMMWHDRLADDVPGGNERERKPTRESQLIGVEAQKNKSAADAASPDVYVQQLPAGAEIPPTLLVHGTMDPQVSPLQSIRVHEVFSARGVDVDLILVDRGRHGGGKFRAVVPTSIEFIQSVFNSH